MKKKGLFIGLILGIFAFLVWKFFFDIDYQINYPNEATKLCIINKKEIQNQFIKHKIKDNTTTPIPQLGLKLDQDLFCAFQVAGDAPHEWKMILALKDVKQFISFLNTEGFIKAAPQYYKNDYIHILIQDQNALISIGKKITPNQFKNWINNQKTQDIAVYFTEDEQIASIINLKNTNAVGKVLLNDEGKKLIYRLGDMNSIQTLDSKNEILIAKFTKEYLHTYFPKIASDSLDFETLSINCKEIKKQADTIITYDLDENFNQIEKKQIRWNAQPQYQLVFTAKNINDFYEKLKQKSWIDAKNQMVIIPFLPNKTIVYTNTLWVGNLTQAIDIPKNKTATNYLYLKPKYLSTWYETSSLIASRYKKYIKNIQSIDYQYNNKENNNLTIIFDKTIFTLK